MDNFKAIRGKVIVKSYTNQKEALMIKGEGGKMIELWMGRQYDENNRRKNPTLCEVVDNNSKYDYIKTGIYCSSTTIICQAAKTTLFA